MMQRISLGLWAGVAGLAMVVIVGGRTAWMAALIVGLIAGLLSGRSEVARTPRQGFMNGLLNGAAAGAVIFFGQLLRSLLIDTWAGQQPVRLMLDADTRLDAPTTAIVMGVGALIITAVISAFIAGAEQLKGLSRTLVLGGLIGAFLLAMPALDTRLGLGWLGDLIPIIIFVLLALGLNIVVGYAGLLDLGYAAFFAIGAYTAGMLSSTHLTGQFGSNFQLSFWLVIWIAAAVAAIFGVILGSPTLPLRGDYLAIVTLGFGEIVPILFTNLDEFTPVTRSIDGEPLNLTGGDRGISAITPPSLPIIERIDGSLGSIIGLILALGVLGTGVFVLYRTVQERRQKGKDVVGPIFGGTLILLVLTYLFFYGTYLPGGRFRMSLAKDGPLGPVGLFTPNDRVPWYFLILGIFGISIFFITRLRRSRMGRAWMAMREDELAAGAMGIDLVKTKLLAFALGATFSGFAGAFYGAYLSSITPSSFMFDKSVLVLCMVILGGLGNIPGVMVGGLIIVSADQFFLNRLTDLFKQIANNLDRESGARAALEIFKPNDFRLILFGAVLVIMMLVRPEGLVPSARRKAELHEHEENGETADQANDSLYDARMNNARLETE